ncbi:hypothetical protein EVG20_g722 [Dentipellis fragilis]|uniref:Uncharacterized protein n=1 Tax=Dentipellis fragilis TaxID=205917 RepID=A0A4Y9ZFS2_9AGAM|nr:hypothetical protein EVG20_g722 [Dentipellis fragilis]
MPAKVQNPPVSAFSEPSEPSPMAPGDKPKDQLTGPQEENPQMVMRKSKEDRKGIDMSGKGGKGQGAAPKRQSKL